MKVRWTEESLRLRLTPSELALLEQRLPVEAALTPGRDGGWHAVLSAADVAATTLTQEGATMHIALSPADLVQLLRPEVEGVYFTADQTHGVRYYIEKDFPCVHPRGVEALEPRTDTFVAPGDFEARKSGSSSGTNEIIGK